MMSRFGRWLGVILVSLHVSQIAVAGELMAVYRQALENAPVLKAAAAERLAKQEILPQSRALWLPRLNLNASVATNRRDPKVGPVDEYQSQGYGLSITQSLYNRANWVLLEQAKEQVGQADANYDAAEQSLMLEVTQRYFDVLAALDTLGFTQAEKAAIERQLQQAQQRFEVGVSAITDVQEARARYDSVVSREITAHNQLDSAREALQELTGSANMELNPLSAGFPLQLPDPNDIERWERIARENNPQLKAARYALHVAEKDIIRQSAARYPSLNLVGSYQRSEAGSLQFVDNDLTAITLQLELPLYQGGGISSRTRQARHRYQQANEELEKMLRSTLRMTRDAFRGVLAGIAHVQALEQALASSQTALKATEAGFEVGTRTIVDVLNVQQELFRVKRDHAVARYNYLLAMLRLKQVAGILQAADLEEVSRWTR